jgi:hypothetical protein
MQGTPNNGNGSGHVLDLNAMLAERRLDPVEVKLGDNTYMVNTDLTGRETQAYLQLHTNQQYAQAWTFLVGPREAREELLKAVERARKSTAKNPPPLPAAKEAKALDAYVDTLPRMHQALVLGSLLRASKALAEFAKTEDDIYKEYAYGLEPAGESTAS